MFQLREGNSFELATNWDVHPYEDSYEKFKTAARQKINTFLDAAKQENCLTYNSSSDRFEDDSKTSGADTWIFPTVQMGLFDVHQDRRVTTRVLQSGVRGSSFGFATGYFNPTADYLDVILNGSNGAGFDLLMAHPKANGFYGSRFPSGGIPPAYTLIANKFYSAVQRSGQEDRIRLFEYLRDGWTFHGKGLWYSPPGEKSLPVATMIGSPNFGYRSVERDLEAQVTVVTKNESLREQLGDERAHLFGSASPVDDATYNASDRRIPNWVKFVVATWRQLF